MDVVFAYGRASTGKQVDSPLRQEASASSPTSGRVT